MVGALAAQSLEGPFTQDDTQTGEREYSHSPLKLSTLLVCRAPPQSNASFRERTLSCSAKRDWPFDRAHQSTFVQGPSLVSFKFRSEWRATLEVRGSVFGTLNSIERECWLIRSDELQRVLTLLDEQS